MTDIAVVIPCFNLGRFVEEAVASARRQSRPPSELVVVDDGSTDPHTRDRLDELARAGTRVVRTPNRGVAAARNHGVRLTSAGYLVTLDADDRLHPEYLARTAAVLDAGADVAFVSTGIQGFGYANYTWTPPAPTIVNTLVRGAPHPATLFRRGVWEAVGGFDESPALQGCEDLDFWLSALEHGFRGQVIEEPLLEYRVRPDSVHQRLVASGKQALVMEAIFRKHRDGIRAVGPELLIEKERFLEEQRTYLRTLAAQETALRHEARQLDARVAEIGDALTQHGSWGQVEGVAAFQRREVGTWAESAERYYVERFLAQHAADWNGDVLVITATEPGPIADVITGLNRSRASRIARPADLRTMPDASTDGVIVIDALHAVWDVRQALADIRRVLRPDGVVLAALPAVRVSPEKGEGDGDYWRFTEAAVRRLLADVFPPETSTVSVHGNVAVCAAAVAGVGVDVLTPAERDRVDPMFPLVYCVRAVNAPPTVNP
ncbi:MAG TPA: glycosyltransferase [Candidatus Tectomicrobia bacterium]|nr:glycosyltransferase [Candidatus Tectomicrobia bacterium]